MEVTIKQILKNCILENSEEPTPENVTHRIISFETCPKSRKFVNVLVHACYYDSAEFNFKPDQNKNR